MAIPSYLRGYEKEYALDPRRAALEWFRQAGYGMFIHYGLYSILGRHEWVQYREKIYVAEYQRLAERFTAEAFNARAVVSFAVECGMKYINLTTRHHDSFCLFNTREADFSSINTPCGCDLVGEMAEACREQGLGLFLYYSHGRDWRHPHAPNNDAFGGKARPEYDPPEPSYAYGEEHDLDLYLEFMKNQITELLTQYGPVAGIWLDGIAVPLSGDADAFRCRELYDHIHSMQPQVLVSYKQGLTGSEDFLAPEHKPEAARFTDKPIEVCTTMCPGSWGYMEKAKGTHKSADAVWDELVRARSRGHNLLLNTAPFPDGSLDPEDKRPLLAVGCRIREEGLPAGL